MRTFEKKTDSLWTPQFITLMVSAVFMYVTVFMFNPTLPLFARSVGLKDPSIGGFPVLAYTMGFSSRVSSGETCPIARDAVPSISSAF